MLYSNRTYDLRQQGLRYEDLVEFLPVEEFAGFVHPRDQFLDHLNIE